MNTVAVPLALALLTGGAAAAAPAALPPPAPASAAFDRCIRGAAGVTADIAACQVKEMKRRDVALNAAYQATLRRLPPGRREALRADERGWIAKRDSSCATSASADAGGTAAGLDAQNCRIDETRTRTAYLQTYR